MTTEKVLTSIQNKIDKWELEIHDALQEISRLESFAQRTKKLVEISQNYKNKIKELYVEPEYKPINHELTELEYERYVQGVYVPTWNSNTGPIKVNDMSEQHLLNLLPYLLKRKFYNWHTVISVRLSYLNAMDTFIHHNQK